MITLGIESTAHTFGVLILKDDKVLCNEKSVYTTESGGIIPVKLVDHHVANCDKVLESALKKAKIKAKDIDLIAFSQGPGMGHALRMGAVMARTLHLLLKKPKRSAIL